MKGIQWNNRENKIRLYFLHLSSLLIILKLGDIKNKFFHKGSSEDSDQIHAVFGEL